MNKYAKLDYAMIGKRIKSLRGAENQADFGAKFERSYTDIGRIERGTVKPTPELLFNICTFYEKSVDWLLTGEGDKFRQTEAQARRFDKYEEQILLLLGGMDDERKKKVLEMVEKEQLLMTLLKEQGNIMGLVQERGIIMDMVKEKKRETGKHSVYKEEKEE